MPLDTAHNEEPDGHRTAEETASRNAAGCLDKLLLIATALLVTMVGFAAFWFADVYHVKPVWVFFAINSIFMGFLLIKDFRNNLKRKRFVLFLLAWAAAHGAVIIGLMRYVPLGAWYLFIVVEGTVGVLLANYLFQARPANWRG
jgi:hypothetical protein